MGCDIHMYVEHRSPKSNHWSDFGGRMNPGRDYELFGRLAGVRDGTQPRIVPARELPTDLGYYARSDSHLYITEGGGEGCCTPADAERYVKYGAKYEYNKDGQPVSVSHPDWHSHSWMHTHEFRNALENHGSWEPSDEYWALLAACEELEKRGRTVRIIFWFDN